MRRIALAFLVWLAFAAASRAQSGFTQVSAIVRDPNGVPYAQCRGNAAFVPAPSATKVPTIGGSTFQTDVPISSCDSFGAFNVVLADNNIVSDGHTSPPASQWRFNITSQDGLTSFFCIMTITGITQNISAPIQACAPPLAGGGGGGGSKGSMYRFNIAGSTPLTAANFQFTGWGTGATISSVTGTDTAFSITMTAGTTPTINPTVTLTFIDGPWTNIYSVNAQTDNGSGNQTYIQEDHTLTSVTLTYLNLPQATKTYRITATVIGTTNVGNLASPLNAVVMNPQGDQTILGPSALNLQGPLNVTAPATFAGITLYGLNGLPILDGTHYPCTDVGMNAAIAALPVSGGKVDASYCLSGMTMASTIVSGSATKPVEIRLPAAKITFTNTSGNGFQLNGSSDKLIGKGTSATTIACATGFTGDLVRAEPPSGGVNIANIDLHDFRTDVTNCRTRIGLNLLSVTEPSYVHGVDILGGLATSVNITTSTLPGASIPEHITLSDMVVSCNSAGTLTADMVINTGNQDTFGPNFYSVATACTAGAFRPLVIKPTSGSNGDGRANLVTGSSFQGAGTCLSVEAPAGAGTGAIGNVIGPGNTFETCTTGYQFTGADASHLATANQGFANFFDSSDTNLFKCDFCQNNFINEKDNGNSGTVTFTANSQGNTGIVRLAGSASDISDLGTANAIWANLNNSGANLSTIGGTFQATSFRSASANPSGSGVILLANGDSIGWRNQANSNNDLLFRNGDVLTDGINGVNYALTRTIATSTTSLGTSAIGSNACATLVSPAATGATTADTLVWSFSTDPNAVTGYGAGSTGTLSVWAFTTTNTANFRVCNLTAGSITPGTMGVVWRVLR
jgi:hypothetical protein